jgi:hypothetical protein
MRRTLTLVSAISLTLVMGLSVIGCGGSSPSKVVRQFYAALEKGDAKAIGELSTPETAELLIPFLEKAKGMAAAYGGITNTEETINGDTATVSVTYKNGSTENYDLVKVNGKWKVSMSSSGSGK